MDLVGCYLVEQIRSCCKIRRMANKGSNIQYVVLSGCSQKSSSPAVSVEILQAAGFKIDPNIIVSKEAGKRQGEGQVETFNLTFDKKLLTKYILNEAYRQLYKASQDYELPKRLCIVHVLFKDKLDSLFYHRTVFLLKYLLNTLKQAKCNLVTESEVVNALLFEQATSILQQTQFEQVSDPVKLTLLDTDIIPQLNMINHIIIEHDEEILVKLFSPVTIEGNTLSDIKLNRHSALYREFISTALLILNNLSFQHHNDQPLKLYLISVRTCSYKVNIIKTCVMSIFTTKVDVEILNVYPIKLPDLTTIDLIRFKRESLEEASKHRLSQSQLQSFQDTDVQERWQKRIDNLTISCLSLDFLRSSSDQLISIRHDQIGDNRDSSFIMYNYARISTLLQSFNEKAEEDYYGMLPQFENVDLSLLKTQEEWCLIFHHINAFSVLLRTLKTDFISTSHHLISYLNELSRDFSSYYSRTYILTENQPHLLPQMYSRIWLVRILQRIYIMSFNLIGIEAQKTM